MIGVFDSGEGGENAVRHIRRMEPCADIALFADRKNAPYGTKSRGELIRLTEAGIRRLAEYGCGRVLIACCTASTVHQWIREPMRRASLPIIEPTAKRAVTATRSGRAAVIATEATVRSHAFRAALGGVCACEVAATELVTAIERGERDGNISQKTAEVISRIAAEVAASEPDTLILGCTHFARLQGEITARLESITKRKIHTVDSSKVGAEHILRSCPEARGGCGRLYRL